MIVCEHEQGTPGWHNDRSGIFTASMFGDLLTSKGEPCSKAKVDTAINLVLSSWLVSGEIASFQSYWMKRGTELEPEARETYEFETGSKVKEVGFCLDDSRAFGASPDGIIEDTGLVEIKCPAPNTMVSYYLSDKAPSQYYSQMQGQLMVTDMMWCDFFAYCPDMPSFLRRVPRDDIFITKLKQQLVVCIDELLKRKNILIERGYKPLEAA